MGYYNRWAVLIFPVAQKTAVAALLTKHGFTGVVDDRLPIIANADDDEAAAKGFAVVMQVDNHGEAVLKLATGINANIRCAVEFGKDEALRKAMNWVRARGYRLKPTRWMILVIAANLLTATNAYLAKHDVVVTQTRALIRKTDPAGANPRAYGIQFATDPFMEDRIWKATVATANTEAFASRVRAQANAEALAFIDSKGLKLKP